MANEVTVIFDDNVWHDVLRTEPYPGAAGLPGAARDRLASAAGITQQLPGPRATRVATFTREEAAQLERWLVDIAGRPDVPASVAVALGAVREGIRLAR
jgi:hypothetical protein